MTRGGRMRLGIIGLGQGAAPLLPAVAALDGVELVAGADPNPLMRERLSLQVPGVRVYADAAELCRDRAVDAVWIASPNRFHCEHALEAMHHGKHVAVDKPMAVTLAEADAMVEAAERCGVALLAAHTDSFRFSIRVMRRLALSGAIGRPRAMLLWSFTDWMLRPRTADELSAESGGGIVHRQAPHQVDTVRLLGGGMLRSVRASVGAWMPERAAPGFYNAFLEFDDGTTAVVVHDGYGYFMTAELFPPALERWRYSDADRIAMRRALRGGAADEEREKEAFRIGGTRAAGASADGRWTPFDLGMLVLSCERGDVRHSERGLFVYGDDGRSEIVLDELGHAEAQHANVTMPALIELRRAITESRPVFHDGRWGRATLEVTLAMLQSARERREVYLTRQVPMPDAYDDDLEVVLPWARA